jgi:hypothetical protein
MLARDCWEVRLRTGLYSLPVRGGPPAARHYLTGEEGVVEIEFAVDGAQAGTDGDLSEVEAERASVESPAFAENAKGPATRPTVKQRQPDEGSRGGHSWPTAPSHDLVLPQKSRRLLRPCRWHRQLRLYPKGFYLAGSGQPPDSSRLRTLATSKNYRGWFSSLVAS